tara:strand:+ start:2913 stop:3827 length:915 start_codon:yes stop_codon:yes gene_type:complete
MAMPITPRLIELSYEAALKTFWRKNALRKFLRANHVSENFLATWAHDESKREFLDRVFEKLQQSSRGQSVIFKMAKNLSEYKSFPDLRDWEDSSHKIAVAKRAVAELRQYISEQESEQKSEEERIEARRKAGEERASIRRAMTDKSKLQERLDDLHSKVGTQEGGYAFEEWFYDALDFCEIQNRRPYKTGGRQIDGSLTHQGTTYLVELKFTGGQCGAGEVDSLRAKIESKADNTMGILLSISGFSSVAINEASGRRTTLLLMDAPHLYAFLSGVISLNDVIARLRRHAAQTGEAYLPVSQFGG